MNPLITSPRALRELATGLSASAIPMTPKLFVANYGNSDVLLTTDDGPETPLVLVWRDDFGRDPIVPAPLVPHRRRALSRMASFAERAEAAQVALPHGWHQYKHDNLISFFAVPGNTSGVRWITERINRGPGLTVFWRIDDGKPAVRLEDVKDDLPPLPDSVFDDWEAAISDLRAHLSEVRGAADAEVYLPHLASTQQQDQTFEGWLSVTSPDQTSFIRASTDKSIRLRGPAGSGKTLTLTLKAVSEILKAREEGTSIRVLLATHSWALATQISQNVDMLGLGALPELEVFPLIAVAEHLSPESGSAVPFTVIGDDSESGKRAQLDEVLELLSDFLATDWVTYRSGTSPALRSRFDSEDAGEHLALAWDLLTEFGSVIGAAGIFPGAGAEARYKQAPRSAWMLQLSQPGDFRVIFRLYTSYMRNLEDRGLVTTDQVVADFLGYLSSHSWNRNRKVQGYDLIFVDEFHLFSPLERQAIHFLTADVLRYPRIFMALDPRQSPSEMFIGAASDATSLPGGTTDDSLGDIDNFELSTVHRFTPQILDLVKHVHHEYPTYALGDDWSIDFSTISSSKDSGPIPVAINAGSDEAEQFDIARAVFDLYSKGRIAIAVVDSRLWPRYSQLATALSKSGKYHVATITAREDIDDIGYRSKGIVIGAAEHLAGLQFETVLAVGVPNLSDATPPPELRRLVSHLYLAMTRAESDVRFFTNDDSGGVPIVLTRAASLGLVTLVQGAQV